MSWTVPSICRRTRWGIGAQTENSTGSDMRAPPVPGDRVGPMMPGRGAANPPPPVATAEDPPSPRSDLELLAHVDPVRIGDGGPVLGPEGAPRGAVRRGDPAERVTR